MLYKESHPSDQELVLAADGECSARRSAAVRAHLACCRPCRVRMNELETAIGDLVHLHQHDLDSMLPPAGGPRALLRARLASLAAEPELSFAARMLAFPPRPYRYVAGALVAAFVLVLAIGVRFLGDPAEPGSTRVEAAAVPKPHLTPGATIPVTRENVCRAGSFVNGPVIPTSLQRQVLEQYGITNPGRDAYEIDYLITPELGGATNIRNLWPQPYSHTAWDARVKDQLEQRLQAMVCHGEIDLATAQRDLATNWISAYKKYFHTDKPLVGRPEAYNQESITARNGWPLPVYAVAVGRRSSTGRQM